MAPLRTDVCSNLIIVAFHIEDTVKPFNFMDKNSHGN